MSTLLSLYVRVEVRVYDKIYIVRIKLTNYVPLLLPSSRTEILVRLSIIWTFFHSSNKGLLIYNIVLRRRVLRQYII